MIRVLALAAALFAFGLSARAELTADQLRGVGVSVPAGAREPLSLRFKDASGRGVTLGQALGGRPTLLVFDDFRCRTLCGPALAIAATSLQQSGLAGGRDLRLVSIGLRPDEPATEAAVFRDAHLSGHPAIAAASAFLIGDAAALARATGAVGYRYAYDAAADQFAHPVTAFMLAADGQVVRTLQQTALDPADLRAALGQAQSGQSGDLVDRLSLLCHGLWPTAGRYDGVVGVALRAAGLACIAAMGAGLTWLSRRRRAS